MICSQLGDNTEGKRHTERTGLTGSEELLMRWRLLVESRRIVLKGGPRTRSRVQEAKTVSLRNLFFYDQEKLNRFYSRDKE